MSDNDDPFAAFGSDRTVIKPSAGRAPAPASPGGAAPAPGTGAGAAGAPGGRDAPLAIDALMAPHLNPLVAAAAALLAAAPRIRAMARHANPNGLKEALAEGVRKFEAQARAQSLPNEQIVAGRYILCTLLDEMAASTPWGGSGVWSAHSLLVQFHNETWGGEKVFQLMSRLAQDIPANRNLLELLYVVLSLGFEGRYRVLDNGRAQLDSVRDRLAQMLQQQRGPYEKSLSPRWQGVPAQVRRLGDGLPLWVLASVVAVLLMAVFAGLRYRLSDRAEPVFAGLAALDVKAAPAAAPPAPPPVAAKPRLAAFLKPEVDAGLVEVQDLADRSVVTIRGDGFFEPGSAVVASAVQPLLARIGEALASTPGAVLVTGHTDNVPIRTLRFPSNWHLSQERAEAVRQDLGQRVPLQRLRAEGRAEAEPVADNSSPAGRARNRRVVVTLFVAPAAP